MKDTFLKIRLSEEEYLNFKNACENKDKTMSETVRIFINTYIKSENLILFEYLTHNKNLIQNYKNKQSEILYNCYLNLNLTYFYIEKDIFV